MKRIFKYVFPCEFQSPQLGKVFMDMPADADLMRVGTVNGQLVLWAEVDPGTNTKPFFFYVRFTGDDVPPEDTEFLGTVVIGNLVYHVYLCLNEEGGA